LKVSSEHEAELKGAQESFQKKKQQWKKRLAAVQEETSKEKEKWQVKLDVLNAKLDKANDRVYQEKARRRALLRWQARPVRDRPSSSGIRENSYIRISQFPQFSRF
jgi:hypothetical protein